MGAFPGMIAPLSSAHAQSAKTSESVSLAMKLRRIPKTRQILTVGIVASKFNKFVTSRLLTGYVKALILRPERRTGTIEVVRVPGPFQNSSGGSPAFAGQVDSTSHLSWAPSFERHASFEYISWK